MTSQDKFTRLIKLSNLPRGLEETELRTWFAQFGDVARIAVMRSKKTSNPSGVAYVSMTNDAIADIIVQKIPHYIMYGKTIKLSCHNIDAEALSKLLSLCKYTKRARYNKQRLSKCLENIKLKSASDKGRALLASKGISLKFDVLKTI